MRLKKGSKVEVFVKKDLPCCSWRIGEIVSGNGRYYDIRYDPLGVNGAQAVERVSRKAIRPSPPRVYTFRDWVPGDLVEVFEVDSMCWKVAVVSELVGVNYFLVRLLGSFEEVRAHKSLLRARQIWIHEKWVLVGMVVGVCDDGKSNLRCYQRSGDKMAGAIAKRSNNGDYQDLHMVSSRTMKKGLTNGPSYVKASKGAGHTLRGVEHEGWRRGVDNEFAGCYSDAESSVGSCSSVKSPYVHSSYPPKHGYDFDSHSSDAESFCGWSYGAEHPFSSKVDMQVDFMS